MCDMKALFLNAAFLSATSALAVFTSGCSTTQAERPVEEGLTDAKLQQMVKTRLQGDASISRLNIGVQADAAHKAVELTGTAFTEKQRTRAVEAAKSVRDGIVVADKIDVKPYEIPKDLFTDEMMKDAQAEATKMGDKMGSSIDDAWLHTKIVAKLIADTKVPERKINVDVNNNVVTLRGTVPSKEAKEQAEAIARGIEGVKDVNNRLMIKS